MKKIGIYLSSDPESGGAFQYTLTILNSIASFPRDSYKIVAAYVSPDWLKYIRFYSLKSKIIFPLVFTFRKFWFKFHLPHILGQKILKYLWLTTAKQLINQKCDLWIFPCSDEISYRVNVPALTTIHDLMHRYERRFPEVSANGLYERREQHYLNIFKFSSGILVDSEVGKQQVHKSYEIPLERIFVLPFIPSPIIFSLKDSDKFNEKYKLPDKFIFYPAQFWEHKNHIRLIKAIYQIRKDYEDIHLVLVGSKKNGYEKAKKQVEKLNLQENVRFIGFVPNEDIPTFYRRARAMVMPTFFGPTNIPPLEAFVLGCPIAVSNIYGMPEQVGNAALLFDPESVEDIAKNITILWTDDDQCNRLIKNGTFRSKLWGQKQFKERLLEISEQVIKLRSQKLIKD